MNIAVIGTGNVGSALGRSLTRSGHRVTFAARDARKAEDLASSIGAGSAATPAEATATADVVVLAVPYGELVSVAGALAPVAAGKVVVDASNPLKADYSGLATAGASAAEQVATAMPGARVVKGFNTLFATNQADPSGRGTTLDALFATDDPSAAGAFAELASSIGFRPVQVGPLAAARELESLAWLNIRLQLLNGGAWQTAYVLVAPPQAALVATPVAA